MQPYEPLAEEDDQQQHYDTHQGQNQQRSSNITAQHSSGRIGSLGPVRRHVPKSATDEGVVLSTRSTGHTAAASTDDSNVHNGGGASAAQVLVLAQALDGEHRRQSLRFGVLMVLGFICLGMTIATLLIFRSRDEFPPDHASIPKTYSRTIRLLPGDDVIPSLMKVVLANGWRAASISTAVGSLTQYNIRFANQNTTNSATGHFEVVSLVGTLTSINSTASPTILGGAWHLHISVGNEQGTTISGHLVTGSIVYTTLEVVMLFNCGVEYYRADDGTTGYDELQIRNATWC